MQTSPMQTVKWLKAAPISADEFNQQYWRKRWVQLGNDSLVSQLAEVLDESSLLDLANNELIESRLIQHSEQGYHLSMGPFALTSLPPDSMLMVQTMETQIEAVSDLLGQSFGFLPRWRIDDVMATYGNAGANCGPHFDHYDVFLLQVRGHKTWHLDSQQHQDTELSEDSDIRLLDQFESEHELIQHPGDILYVPPGAGHHGIASDDSLTLSIGIRNPTMQEMISHIADMAGDALSGADTLDDSLTFGRADISTNITQQLSTQLADQLASNKMVNQWFGRYMTELREPEMIEYPDEPIDSVETKQLIQSGGLFQCHLASRLTWQSDQISALIFANGECFPSDLSALTWFQTLESARVISCQDIDITDQNLHLVSALLDSGAIFWTAPEANAKAKTQSSKTYNLRLATWAQDEKLLHAVRYEVFVVEQHTPVEEEYDAADADAWHWLATDSDNNPIGTGRLLKSGQIGRMAISKSFRGHGVGAAILELAVQHAASLGFDEVFLNAQTHALSFYEKAGFRPEGDIFDEVGIAHRRMVRQLVE